VKFMIRTDVEGVTGVTTYEQAESSPFGRAMLMNDVRAVIDGLLAEGDHEIVIYDEHTDGRNVHLVELPEVVSVICGKPPYRPDWGGIDNSFNAMLMVGFHARSGVPGALLPHSYSRRNLSLRINGKEVGEIGMEAAIAGEAGVPLWLVSGDSAGMAEAAEIVPGVRTVTVKEAMGEFAALCYPPKLTARRLYAAAQGLLRDPPTVKPLRFRGPITLEIDLEDTPFLHALRTIHPEELVVTDAAETLRLEAASVTEAWSWFLEVQAEVGATVPG
jgi:D-amino peptidase